jgi:hypothetical protein
MSQPKSDQRSKLIEEVKRLKRDKKQFFSDDNSKLLSKCSLLELKSMIDDLSKIPMTNDTTPKLDSLPDDPNDIDDSNEQEHLLNQNQNQQPKEQPPIHQESQPPKRNSKQNSLAKLSKQFKSIKTKPQKSQQQLLPQQKQQKQQQTNEYEDEGDDEESNSEDNTVFEDIEHMIYNFDETIRLLLLRYNINKMTENDKDELLAQYNSYKEEIVKELDHYDIRDAQLKRLINSIYKINKDTVNRYMKAKEYIPKP